MLRLDQCVHTEVPGLEVGAVSEALEEEDISYNVVDETDVSFSLFLDPRDEPSEATPYTSHIFTNADVTRDEFVEVSVAVRTETDEITFTLDTEVYLDTRLHFAAVDSVIWNILEDEHEADEVEELDDVIVYHTDQTNPALSYPLLGRLYNGDFTIDESFQADVSGNEFVFYPDTVVPRTAEAQKNIDNVAVDVAERLDSHAAAVDVENPFHQLPVDWFYPAVAASDYSGQIVAELFKEESDFDYDRLEHLPAIDFFLVHDLLLLGLLDSLHEHCSPAQRKRILTSNREITNILVEGLMGDDGDVDIPAVRGSEWLTRLERAVRRIHNRHHETIHHLDAYESAGGLDEGDAWKVESPQSSATMTVTVVGQDLIEYEDMQIPGWFGEVQSIDDDGDDVEAHEEVGDVVPIIPAMLLEKIEE